MKKVRMVIKVVKALLYIYREQKRLQVGWMPLLVAMKQELLMYDPNFLGEDLGANHDY